MSNPAREALTRAVNRALAEGSPEYVNEPERTNTMSLEDHKVEETEYLGYTIGIYYDSDPVNPRKDFDHAAEMVSLDSREFSLDRDATGTEYDAADRGILARWYSMQRAYTLFFRIADYGSGGYLVRETALPEGDANGFLLLTSERIQSEGISDPEACLKAEFTEFEQYLTGDVYGYVITDPKGNEVESVWGFYGLDYCREEAQTSAKAHKDASYWKGMHSAHPC